MNEQDLNTTLAELRELQQKAQDSFQQESDEWWESLSTEDQQLAFYTVMRKMYQYRVVEGRGYRGTLYDGFGWGGEAYGMGMDCGFFALHNMIHDALHHEEYKSDIVEKLDALKTQCSDYIVDPHIAKELENLIVEVVEL